MQLLDARAEADAEPFAAAEGDQRVRELVALAERIGPRIHEAEDALHAVGRGRRSARRSRRRACRAAPAKWRPFMPPRNRMPNAIDRDHHERAEVGLAQQQPRRRAASPRASAASRLLEALHAPRLAHRVVGGVEHRGELHELRGLHARRTGATSQRRAPFTSRPTPGISTSDEQRDAGDEQPRRGALPQLHRHVEHRERGGERRRARNSAWRARNQAAL